VEEVLHILKRKHLFAKRSKYSLGQKEVKYLGYLVSEQGVRADPQKMHNMETWSTPTTIKALRGFLGLTEYYKRFVKDYGKMAKPLMTLLQKDAFQWNKEAEQAFAELKRAMSTTPVLALPDFTKGFIVETDASGKGVGAVLLQEERPIAYYSKAFSNRTLGLSTYEKEMIAKMFHCGGG